MNRLVECVPNFSEGRRPAVMDAIVNAITSVSGVYLLGHEMDADHNRAVVTIVGTPESIGEAAVRGAGEAVKRIDLTTHQGEHPRMGAVDVIPFIPIRGVTIEQCLAIATQTAQEIASRFHVPIYLYERAARRPDRVNLENVRRGQFEGLRTEIVSNPDRKPDFGPSQIHPTAGATAVGVRKPLVAYNINLGTNDVGIAKFIAKRVRHSSGGFRNVKAMGVLLAERNLAQVSMNLTDYEQTPIQLVFETVRREAERYGVQIVGSEIVGLVPQKALDQTAEYYLRLEQFRPDMILENRLQAVIESSPTSAAASGTKMADALRGFVDRVASPEPLPGGGSVSALAGSLGAALGQMAIRITKEKKNYLQYRDRFTDALDRLGPYSSIVAGPGRCRCGRLQYGACSLQIAERYARTGRGHPKRSDPRHRNSVAHRYLRRRSPQGSGGPARADSHQRRIRPPGRHADAAVLVAGRNRQYADEPEGRPRLGRADAL